jgi:PilX N-terminal
LRARGAVLLLALVFMLMLTMIAATVMQTSILQLHMAGNDQFLEEVLQRAQAIADELSLDVDNFLLQGDVGDVNCPSGSEDPICTQNQLRIPESIFTTEGIELEYRVTRREPLLWHSFPIRQSESTASSSSRFDAALFEIEVRIDGSKRGLGSARVIQGIAVRVPAVD